MNDSQATSKIQLTVKYDERGNPHSVVVTPLTPNPEKETPEPDGIYNPQTGLIGYPDIALFDDDEEFLCC